MGLRLDWFTAGSQAQTTPANPQFGLPARSFAELPYGKVADWKDLDPRMGVAYDVFGNGKTAIKASLARGVLTEGLTGITSLGNPVQDLVTSTTRPFNDLGGTLNPTYDANINPGGGLLATPVNPFASAAASGCGINGNSATTCVLGKANTPGFYTTASNFANVQYADNVTSGWQNRQYNWQFNAQVQQEVARGIAVTFAYYRTWYGNLTAAKNGLPSYSSAPGNYNQYCVTAPATTAAQNGAPFSNGALGGNTLCNLYDPTSANLAAADSDTIEQSCIFGCYHDVYTGIDGLVNARWHGLIVQGGITAGHEVTNYCNLVNSPQDMYYNTTPTPVAGVGILEFPNFNFTGTNDAAPCSIDPPWTQNLQFKAAVVYTLPWQQIKLSANEQNLPSIPLQASYTYSNTCGCLSTPTGSLFPGTLSGANTGAPKIELVTPQTVFNYGREQPARLPRFQSLHDP